MSAVDIRTSTIAPPARLRATDDALADFLIMILDGIQPVERREEWLRRNCPRTAAWLGVRVGWDAMSEAGE